MKDVTDPALRTSKKLSVSPDRAWWVCFLGLCAILVAPLLVVDVPPLVDYPNHLARAFVLSVLPGDPVIARFYQPHWTIIPNLAIDLIAPPLMHVLPVHVVGRLLIAASVLLPVLGSVAYGRVLGSRWWCLAVGLVAYNGTLLEGFLNFSLSIGLALLLAASWIRWRDGHPVPAIMLSIAGGLSLFACHLMGLVFLALLLASAEFVSLRRHFHSRSAVVRNVARRGCALGLVFVAPALLYLVSPLSQLGEGPAFLPPYQKLAQLLVPFTNYSLILDTGTAVLVGGCVGLCLLLRRGWLPPPAALAALLTLVAYIASPYAWKGTYQLDTRFVIMLGFLMFAGFQPLRWPSWLIWTTSVAVVLLFVARMSVLTIAWTQHAGDLADLRRALAPVQPGQSVYVASAVPADPRRYWTHAPWSRHLSDGVQTDTHLAALALIERRAWWPYEFDVPSQQPIVTRQPYAYLAEHVGDLPDQNRTMAANLCGFDWVLMTQADAVADLPASRFRLVVRAGFASLYAIRTCQP